ncbi:ABC transporter substrate-binding protein [Pantoea eucalypti]|jgi:putative hydroxymethylpyrimidine transport system substrate-binding protein|uniref:Transporter substrate-binding domain-containing protein n=1 Tax=Pantoea eucalypti TaxID=470933 RepID=A0ABY2ZMS8_9GAMM|nr:MULTISPECIES: ABC transporter substrate-binding protein [Pantoea]PQL27775.1 thiamine biosynthesis protein [Pantoea ananatis]QXG56885.1 ABC transporter substrate-binding protein [Pantoea jilinensis]AWP35015.1 thiamine biosynthesis protein [Pantoea vagans]ELP23021.1 Hydroxymethylpyrimidine ABC transporter, substrate-binding component [Pantoea agglomerans 299R]MBD9552873.1 ABC transporter substrate-binding protein [Pantoea sp. PNT01]
MTKLPLLTLLFSATLTTQVQAMEKLTLVLDWYINPDHAPIMVAQQTGAFAAEGLEVNIVPPSDPALPPRLVAAKQADLAITYQPQLHFFADQGLPLMRVGTLIDTPLNTLMTLDKTVKKPADLKGKRIGYSVSGIEQATLATMLAHDGVKADQVKLINVNFQLTSALMTGQVDAVIGGYRNIEALELKLAGKEPVVLNVEDYGVPAYDELIIVANRDEAHSEKIQKFLRALKKGNAELQAHPEENWLIFAREHPELNTPLNHQAWRATLPLFAADPAKLDRARYQAYEQFLFDNKLIKGITPVQRYAIGSE